ncbi:MAG: hypothetical protein WCN95_14455 [bacterium]
MTTMTLGAEAAVGYRMDDVAVAGAFVHLAPHVGETPREHANVRVRSMDPRDTRPADLQKKKVLRRMQGFLIEIVGDEAKVAFVEGGVTHEYYIPWKHLHGVGIGAENQPFQMDEVEIKTETGVIVGYEFQALARPSDAFPDSFKLDAERERKRNLIFKAFGHAKT